MESEMTYDTTHASVRQLPSRCNRPSGGLDPRLVDTRSGGLCRLSESVFEVDGTHHSEGRMASASVVDSLDPVADAELGGCLGRPQVPVVELDFQCGPK